MCEGGGFKYIMDDLAMLNRLKPALAKKNNFSINTTILFNQIFFLLLL